MWRVLSLGGSIVSLQNGVNVDFLKKFKRLIESRVEKGDRFIIVVGGGSLARQYASKAEEINKKIKIDDKDYLGIYATWLNAFLVKSIFPDLSHDELITNPKEKIKTKKPLIFSGGYMPGSSSDFVAVLLAETYKVDTIVNLSNVDYVYDRDPNRFNQAKKIKGINWSDFLELIGDDWRPGLNAPFDPIASLRCQKNKKSVVVLNGQNLSNLSDYFLGKNFIGTTIKP
jgi:uridylate kinase